MSINSDLVIKQMIIGPMGNFAYFVGSKSSKEIAIIDPGWDVEFLQEEAKKEDLLIKSVWLTHSHYDHMSGVPDLIKNTNITVYISQEEADFDNIQFKNTQKLAHKQKIKIGNVDVLCLLTPGHSVGGMCFLVENNLFTGDTLFVNGCGRCDLAGGDPRAMYTSLYEIIGSLPDETVIFSGHEYGPKSSDTLGNQKKTNPFLTCTDMEQFLYERM